MKTYYYIKYTITNSITNNICHTTCVTNESPFDWLKFFNNFTDKWNLTDWKKISKNEYEKGKELIGIG